MSTFTDRRLNPRDKTIKNRQKFIERSREQIKKAVKESIDNGNIADIENGKVRVKVKGVSEPTFGIDSSTGNKKYILPGNKEFVVGDEQEKPDNSNGQGGQSGGLGRGEDDFEFILNREEFLDFIFEDLELPNLVKKQMKDVSKVKPQRAGYTNTGNPSQLDVIRSLKNSLGRRIGLNRPKNENIEELEEELAKETEPERIAELEQLILELKQRQGAIPWLDPFDVRYRNFVPVPQPITKAVMFCVMDVSGSMGKREKDLAKRFFLLLHMFLNRKYQKVDIVFIRHHEEAFEVDEQEFFNSRESGGTVVSTAIKMTKDIIEKRYNINDWNIYVAQVSDGDNHSGDVDECEQSMMALLPLVQYFAYVEIKNMFGLNLKSNIWEVYEVLEDLFQHLKLKKASAITDIWLVFKDLFSKERS